ncbi:hypothetical protein ACNJUT_21270, partial [Mycobacterium tuberculosis]
MSAYVGGASPPPHLYKFVDRKTVPAGLEIFSTGGEAGAFYSAGRVFSDRFCIRASKVLQTPSPPCHW